MTDPTSFCFLLWWNISLLFTGINVFQTGQPLHFSRLWYWPYTKDRQESLLHMKNWFRLQLFKFLTLVLAGHALHIKLILYIFFLSNPSHLHGEKGGEHQRLFINESFFEQNMTRSRIILYQIQYQWLFRVSFCCAWKNYAPIHTHSCTTLFLLVWSHLFSICFGHY